MAARIFIHPRCISGPASGALAVSLQERGYDLAKWGSFALGSKMHELCRIISEAADSTMMLERGDGKQFEYNPSPQSEAA